MPESYIPNVRDEHAHDPEVHFHSAYDPAFSMLSDGGFDEYVTSGSRWTDGGGLTSVLGGAGGTISWSLGGAGLSDVTGHDFYTGASVAMSTFLSFDFEATLQRAFDAWSEYGDIEFVQVTDGGGDIGVGATPTIRVVGGYIDGQGGPNVLARAFYPHPDAFGGDIVFDNGNTNFYSDEHSFFLTALHEIGHAIGLMHEDAWNAIAVMNPVINTSLSGLQPDDIAGVQAVYGVQINDAPTLTASASNPTFTEGGAAGSLFSGTTISTDESWQTITGLSFEVANVTDGSDERINVDGTSVVLTHGTSGTTASNALSYSVSVAGTTATVSLSGGTLSTSAAQTLIDNMSYQNNSDVPDTSNRVVTLTSIQDSGGTANGGDDTAALSTASTVTVVGVNDAPTLSSTASDPTFTEGGAAGSLFSGTSISTVEGGQTIQGLTLTVSNVANGASEVLNIDGTAVGLTHGASGTTATNALSYSVSVAGSTATVTLTSGTLSTAAAQTLINGISYQNNSDVPDTSNRVVTLTSMQDSGGTANGGDDTAALSTASTVTVVGVNDAPTLTASASNPTFTEGGAAGSLFSGASISTIEAGQSVQGLTLTVSNVANGASEALNIDGTAVVLTHGTGGTTASNALSYSVSVAGSTATVTLTGGTLSTAAAQTLINGISYQNNSDVPDMSNRVVTLTSIQDSGGTANGGDDTAALSTASTVTVVEVNDAPTLTATASNPTSTEGGAAGSLFSGTSISTVEGGQTITGLTLTVTNVTNGSDEQINIDGSPVVLTHGTNGTTAGNSLTYSVTVAGTTATVTMTGGTLSSAAAQTLIDNMSYRNSSNDPDTADRVVTLTSLQDSGGTANGGDDTAALAEASTVTLVAVNDAPSIGLRFVETEFPEDFDTSSGLRVANIRISDPDGGNNVLSLSGADARLFELDSYNVVLREGVDLDFETNPVLDVTVHVKDAGLPAESSVALRIDVTDVNEAPALEVMQLVPALPAGGPGTTRSAVATVDVVDDGLGTNDLSLHGAEASAFELDAGVLYLRAGMTLNPANPVDLRLEVDDPSLGSRSEDSTTLVFDVVQTFHEGGNTDDLLIGTLLPDTLSGLGGNDTLVGQESDDLLDGGEGGGDVAVFTGPAESYSVAITPDGVIVTDRREGGDGSDLLIDIETIRFGADPAGMPQEGEDFDLANYSGASLLTTEQLETITQFYVGLYDRAPDALGLLYWATQLANGMSEAAIAQAFINSPEAIDIYGAAPSSLEIVEAAYANFFDREVDLAGQVFWSDLLDRGVITVSEFFTQIDDGAEASTGYSMDAVILQDQMDIGLYFAAINGLSDVSDATSMLALYDKEDRDDSLAEAKDMIDALALDATMAGSGEFLVQLTGVIDDPFA